MDQPLITAEQQTKEWLRCAKSFSYFSAKYLYILEIGKGLVPFKLYGFQERALDNFESHQFNIVHKFRQGGLTTLAALWGLWRCMFKTDQQILVMSITDREAVKVGKIIKRALDYIHNHFSWMAPRLQEDSAHIISFIDTGSQIEFRTTKAARGQTLTYLIVDEAAFIQGMDEAWSAMYPTVSTGGNVIVISTVNGMGNWYEQMYHDAEAERNEFNIIRLNYKEHPKYSDPEWERKTRSNMSDKKWAQEYLGSFLGSGETYIKPDTLAKVAQSIHKVFPLKKLFSEWDSDTRLFDLHELSNDPMKHEWVKGALWVWKEAYDGREYIMGVDGAEGVGEGGDNSAFQVIDSSSLEQVAEFSSNTVPPNVFATLIAEVAAYYNMALVVVESAASGLTILDKLIHTLCYENVYHHLKLRQEKPGFPMNPSTRPLVLEAMQKYMENNLLKVNSPRLVQELSTFTYNPSKKRPMATKGKHDDLVISMAIALFSRDKSARDLPIGIDSTVALADQYGMEMREAIRRTIVDAAPKDLVADVGDEKFPWESNGMTPGIEVDFERPLDGLLREFGW